ncbi:MAG TPA: urate oxidase [Streptosporangiaceae bacterium]|jgi:urate oxidase
MVQLGANRYGKAEVRVVHVDRTAGPDGPDRVRDWNVSTSLAGDLASVHLSGDNAHALPTDTQKNTVYAMAKKLGGLEPEAFGLELAAHYTGSQEAISRARIAIEEYPWAPLGSGGHSFARSGQYTRTTTVIEDRELGRSVVSGVADLIVLNTTGSQFWGFPRDEYTTLADAYDRMLATTVSASWRFRTPDADWGTAFTAAFTALTDAFTQTPSYSLQQTLYGMGSAVLAAVPELCEVRLALPNKHHFVVDLAPFGLANEDEVYYAADRPYGLIEGTVLADDAPDAGIAWS